MRLGHLTSLALAATLAVPAFAGDKAKKCAMDAQACLTKMAAELKDRGWVGIEFDEKDGALTITRVVEKSPAEAAGLRAGDLLLATNGLSYAEENHKEMKALYKSLKPGAKATYTVKRDGARKEVQVTLGELPRGVLAQWIGSHMLDGHTEVQVAAN